MHARVVQKNSHFAIFRFKIVPAWCDPRINLTYLAFAHLQKDNRAFLDDRVDDEGRKHDDEHRAEREAEVALVPLEIPQ